MQNENLPNTVPANFSNPPSKANSTSPIYTKGNLFCRCFVIESEANRIFAELKHEKYLKNLNVADFSKRLAYYFSEINALHPFRESNGRAQREFVRQLAYQNGYFLSFTGISQDEMIAASVAGFKLDYTQMENLILTHLRPL